MTDRCVTNDCVDRKLEEALGEKLNSFRCSMHPLDSFYHACKKAVKTYEDQVNNKPEKNQQTPFKKGSESETHALIRAVDKLFNNLGSGCGQELRTYLHSIGYINSSEVDKSEIFFRLIGNRFNIFFLDAMLVFSYSNAIQEFFLQVHQPTTYRQSIAMLTT